MIEFKDDMTFIAHEPPHQQDKDNLYVFREKNGLRDWLVTYRATPNFHLAWNWSPSLHLGLEPLNWKRYNAFKEALEPMEGYTMGIAEATGEYALAVNGNYIDEDEITYTYSDKGGLSVAFKTTPFARDALVLNANQIKETFPNFVGLRLYPVYRELDERETKRRIAKAKEDYEASPRSDIL